MKIIQNQSFPPQPQPQQPQSLMQDYMSINQVQSNKVIQPIQKTQTPSQQKPPQQQIPANINREGTNNLLNSIFNNYEPKIKLSYNLKDETLDILDKYVTDPEVKGVEELGKISYNYCKILIK